MPLDDSDLFYAVQDKLSGVVDKRGNWVIRPCFELWEPYMETRVEMKALCAFEGKYFLGKNGNLIVPVGEQFSDAPTPLRREVHNERHIFVNKRGETVLTITPSKDGDIAGNASGKIIWPLSKTE